MKRLCFRKITKLKCEDAAFSELTRKLDKRSMGRTLMYGDKLEMANHLSPSDQLTTNNQKLIFQIRSQQNPLPANIGGAHPCVRGLAKLGITATSFSAVD